MVLGFIKCYKGKNKKKKDVIVLSQESLCEVTSELLPDRKA